MAKEIRKKFTVRFNEFFHMFMQEGDQGDHCNREIIEEVLFLSFSETFRQVFCRRPHNYVNRRFRRSHSVFGRVNPALLKLNSCGQRRELSGSLNNLASSRDFQTQLLKRFGVRWRIVNFIFYSGLE